MINAALVLEGGSLRCLYTAGVLDLFMEKNIEFSCVIGVSAGALTAANYISKQKWRTAQINVLHSCDDNYYGLKQLILKRNAFNFDYLFENPINQLYPYDSNRLLETKQKFYVAATDCRTGQVEYFKVGNDYSRMTDYLRTSSSIPLISQMAKVDGQFYLDGGIAAPIGIEKALVEGFEKIVVVSTREKQFVKKDNSMIIKLLFRILYRKYPCLLKALNNIPNTYNDIQNRISEMELENKIFVIRPENLGKIRSVEKDARKLIKLYFQGLKDADDNLQSMMEYLYK